MSLLSITIDRRREERASDYLSSTDVVKGVDTSNILDQAWFWTPEWQARYQLGVLELDSGNYVEFDNGDDFIASLDDL